MVQAFIRPRPPLPGARIKASVDDMKNGQYRVTFDLLYTGHCELLVLVNGANIQGSPFSLGRDPIPESPFLLTRHDMIMGAHKGVLQFPDHPGCLTGVATPSDGTIFVTDHSNHEIHVFDKSRNFHKSYGQEGVGDCEFLNPRSVVATLRGILYVASDNGIDALSDKGFFSGDLALGYWVLCGMWLLTIESFL